MTMKEFIFDIENYSENVETNKKFLYLTIKVMRTIYVKFPNQIVTDFDLNEIFSIYGPIFCVKVHNFHAFIEFEIVESASNCVKNPPLNWRVQRKHHMQSYSTQIDEIISLLSKDALKEKKYYVMSTKNDVNLEILNSFTKQEVLESLLPGFVEFNQILSAKDIDMLQSINFILSCDVPTHITKYFNKIRNCITNVAV